MIGILSNVISAADEGLWVHQCGEGRGDSVLRNKCSRSWNKFLQTVLTLNSDSPSDSVWAQRRKQPKFREEARTRGKK